MRLLHRCMFCRRIVLFSLMVFGWAGSGLWAESLTRAELTQIYHQAADRALAYPGKRFVIAVVDRDGQVLLGRNVRNGKAVTSGSAYAIAVSKAGTAVFLSSNGHAFTSRTAGFIIQQNFPPFIKNRPPGPLVGVGFSNLAFSDVNFFSELDGTRILGTRLYASPGGVPIYKNGVLVAGIGVTGDGTEQEDASIAGRDIDEEIALTGQIGFAPSPRIKGSLVFIDGIRVAYTRGRGVVSPMVSKLAPPALPEPPEPVVWPEAVLGGVRGEVRTAFIDDPLRTAGNRSRRKIDKQRRLTQAEVTRIISAAAARSQITRAGIRLPAGKAAQVFITVVNNPDKAGEAPTVLGTFRTPDATIFSWDVAVQKARTAVFFSNNKRAFSTRTIGFLAQSMYPPGIEGTKRGPFNGLQERFSGPLLSGGTPNPNLPNGITIFPGGLPLYRNGVLIGAIGVSGDGIDQDDLIAAAGTAGFLPPKNIRADRLKYRGARLPYAKFPRDPFL